VKLSGVDSETLTAIRPDGQDLLAAGATGVHGGRDSSGSGCSGLRGVPEAGYPVPADLHRTE